jgi:hypothetical protein
LSRKGLWKGYRDDATTDVPTLQGWANEYRGINWCVATGPASGIWALDVDVFGPDHAADGVTALHDLTEKHGALPPRPTLRSGGGGYAMFFAWTADSPTSSRTAWPAPGLDIRGPRVVTTLPPSTHRRTGEPYRWLIAPWDVPPPPAPDWLLKACAPPPRPEHLVLHVIPTTDRAMRRLSRACDTVAKAEQGRRNAALNRECFIVGGYVGAGLLSRADAARALHAAAINAGLEDREACDTIQSGLLAGIAKPMEARL